MENIIKELCHWIIAHLIIDKMDDLHDGVVCLMIFGLTRNMAYVLHSIP